MDKCEYCKEMISSGFNHYCKEELVEQITDLQELLNKFYVKFENGMPREKRQIALTVSSANHSLLLVKLIIEKDKDWDERTDEYCENLHWPGK